MKKAVIIWASIVMILILGFFTVTALNSMSVLEGYSLSCDNGSYMIIEETGSPICYRFNKAIGTDVEKLTDGDRILIISDLINESYPGSTSAYCVFKLSDGEISDIPEDTLRSLSELGWCKFTE